jgi:hypothetical protein
LKLVAIERVHGRAADPMIGIGAEQRESDVVSGSTYEVQARQVKIVSPLNDKSAFAIPEHAPMTMLLKPNIKPIDGRDQSF